MYCTSKTWTLNISHASELSEISISVYRIDTLIYQMALILEPVICCSSFFTSEHLSFYINIYWTSLKSFFRINVLLCKPRSIITLQTAIKQSLITTHRWCSCLARALMQEWLSLDAMYEQGGSNFVEGIYYTI